jgi:hypothetical protein
MHRLMYICSSALHPSIHVHPGGSKVTKSLAQGLHENVQIKSFQFSRGLVIVIIRIKNKKQ